MSVPTLTITAFDLAQRFVGVEERRGLGLDHPLIVWWLELCGLDRKSLVDETPWCSAFVNGIAWDLRLPRSKSARARSWLRVGTPVDLDDARPGFDVVILKRSIGGGALDTQPGPDDHTAPGHVAFFAGLEGDAQAQASHVLGLGGNQGDRVSIARFPVSAVLGVRRLL